MSERWCDDCSWPYECMADHACRRAEQGERRVAATAETAEAIARALPPPSPVIVMSGVVSAELAARIAAGGFLIYDEAADYPAPPLEWFTLDPPADLPELRAVPVFSSSARIIHHGHQSGKTAGRKAGRS